MKFVYSFLLLGLIALSYATHAFEFSPALEMHAIDLLVPLDTAGSSGGDDDDPIIQQAMLVSGEVPAEVTEVWFQPLQGNQEGRRITILVPGKVQAPLAPGTYQLWIRSKANPWQYYQTMDVPRE